eukprot:scaffold655_cov379-Prasinococcus_capsulatus_cf.AAC.7
MACRVPYGENYLIYLQVGATFSCRTQIQSLYSITNYVEGVNPRRKHHSNPALLQEVSQALKYLEQTIAAQMRGPRH